MTRRTFTGWHMAALLVAFFGVVVAVNFYMAHIAISTFGGTVVDNSYVASQEFNGWLEKARRQKALGWRTRLTVDPARRVELNLAKHGVALGGAVVSGVARHPLGRAPDVPLSFRIGGPGQFRSIQSLPAGRWLVHVAIIQDGHEMRLIESLQ